MFNLLHCSKTFTSQISNQSRFSCFVMWFEVITVYMRNIPSLYPMEMKLSADANFENVM